MPIALILCVAFIRQTADLTADARLDKHVTYRSVAAPTKVALTGLAQAAGLPLAAAGTVQSEFLLLRLEDVPIRDAMVRISRATAASWVSDNGTYYLTRTDADNAKRTAADHARIVASIKKEFAKQAAALASQKPFDSGAAQALLKKVKMINDPRPAVQSGGDAAGGVDAGGSVDVPELERQTPTGRLIARVLARLDPEVIALAPARRRTVFSTNPTRMEAPLHADLSDVAETFVAEQSIYATEMAAYSEPDRVRLQQSFDGFFNAKGTKLEPAKINISVNRLDNNADGIGLELQVIDAAGGRTAWGSVTVPVDPEFPSERELMADPNEQKLPISPDDMTVMQVLGATLSGKRAKVTELPDNLRARMLQPDKNELLATFPSNLLLALADARHLNIVADLPDAYVILGATPSFTGLPTANSLLKLVSALPPSLGPVRIDDKWLEVGGGEVVTTGIMAHRSNREALAQLFSSSTDGVLSIENLARYAFVGDGVPDDFIFLAISAVLFPGSDADRGSEQWQTLKLIGSIIRHQANAPLKPGRIALGSLDADSLAQLENIVFFQEPFGFSKGRPAGDRVDFAQEDPCEILAAGLPRDAYIDVAVEESDSVFSTGPHPQPVKANQLAFYQEMQEHPDRYGGGVPRYTITDHFRVGTMREIQLRLELGSNLSKQMSVREQHIGNGSPVAFSDLPKKFRDEYQRAKDSFNRPGG